MFILLPSYNLALLGWTVLAGERCPPCCCRCGLNKVRAIDEFNLIYMVGFVW